MKMSFYWNEFAQLFPFIILGCFHCTMFHQRILKSCRSTLGRQIENKRDKLMVEQQGFCFNIYWNLHSRSSSYNFVNRFVMNQFNFTNTNIDICEVQTCFHFKQIESYICKVKFLAIKTNIINNESKFLHHLNGFFMALWTRWSCGELHFCKFTWCYTSIKVSHAKFIHLTCKREKSIYSLFRNFEDRLDAESGRIHMTFSFLKVNQKSGKHK